MLNTLYKINFILFILQTGATSDYISGFKM